MATSEGARSDLYTGLRELLGPDRAETLMSGFALHELDAVATKSDIAELRAEFKGDLAQVQRTIISWMVTLVAANVASVIGVALIS